MAETVNKPVLTLVKDKPKLPLNVVVARQNTEYFTGPEFPELESLTKPFNYVLTSDGLYDVRNVRAGWFINKVGSFKNTVPGFVKSEVKAVGIPRFGKIPYALFEEVYAFFKSICDASKDEAYVQTFWDPEKKCYFNHVPEQEVSGASVKFIRDQELEERCPLVLETHSHNQMNAFFSGTDNADEKSDRFFGVMGKLNTLTPEFKYSYRCGKERLDIRMNDLFEGAPEATFPSEWKEKIKKAKATVVKYTGGGYQGGNYKYAGYGHWTNKPSSYGLGDKSSLAGATHAYGQKKPSTKKEREEIQKAAKEAEEAMAGLEELFSEEDPDIKAFLTDNSIEVEEDESTPFFPVSSDEFSTEEGEYDTGEDLEEIVGDTLLEFLNEGEEMTEEKKLEVFGNLVGCISDDDAACLAYVMAQYGHSETMIEQMKAFAEEEEEVAV